MAADFWDAAELCLLVALLLIAALEAAAAAILAAAAALVATAAAGPQPAPVLRRRRGRAVVRSRRARRRDSATTTHMQAIALEALAEQVQFVVSGLTAAVAALDAATVCSRGLRTTPERSPHYGEVPIPLAQQSLTLAEPQLAKYLGVTGVMEDEVEPGEDVRVPAAARAVEAFYIGDEAADADWKVHAADHVFATTAAEDVVELGEEVVSLHMAVLHMINSDDALYVEAVAPAVCRAEALVDGKPAEREATIPPDQQRLATRLGQDFSEPRTPEEVIRVGMVAQVIKGTTEGTPLDQQRLIRDGERVHVDDTMQLVGLPAVAAPDARTPAGTTAAAAGNSTTTSSWWAAARAAVPPVLREVTIGEEELAEKTTQHVSDEAAELFDLLMLAQDYNCQADYELLAAFIRFDSAPEHPGLGGEEGEDLHRGLVVGTCREEQWCHAHDQPGAAAAAPAPCPATQAEPPAGGFEVGDHVQYLGKYCGSTSMATVAWWCMSRPPVGPSRGMWS